MKFLLVGINAKFVHSNPGLYSLRAFAGESGKHVEVAEYTINNRLEYILGEVYERKPDVLAFSCYIWNWKLVRELVVECGKVLPGVPIWLGGPEVSFDPERVLEELPLLAGVMVGEGEVTFRDLLECYLNGGGGVSEVSGVVTGCGRSGDRGLTDLDALPFLYGGNLWELGGFENRIVYYESGRGCPFRCSYCLSSIDKSVRLRSMGLVEAELQFFLDRSVPQVKFVDRTFNCDHNHAMSVWQFIEKNDNGITNFHFEIAADIIREEELVLLNRLRPGLVQLEIGVQSANKRTLEEIHRFVEMDRLKQVVCRIRLGGNIHVHLDLIAGLPYEDYDSFVNSFNQVYGMEPDQLQLGFLKVLKGSEMHHRALEYGIHYLSEPPYEVLFTNWLSYEELLQLKAVEEMVELYYNSGQFSTAIPFLVGLFPSAFALFEGLADFYRRKGYFLHVPARAYRYQVLLEFAAERDAAHRGLYEELLVYDMYLRENLKSRPVFAPDMQIYSELTGEFFKREEKKPHYLKGYGGCTAKQMSRMTHVEVFRYFLPGRGEGRTEENGSGCRAVLFDYKERNPLNHQAMTYVIMENGVLLI